MRKGGRWGKQRDIERERACVPRKGGERRNRRKGSMNKERIERGEIIKKARQQKHRIKI